MNKISGSRNKRPDKAHDVPAPTQRKKVKASDWEQTGPTEGGPVDPELIPSYGGHDRGLLKCRLRYIALIWWNLIDAHELFDVATSSRSTMSSSYRAACYLQYLLGSLLFTDKSGNIVLLKLWLLAWIYMYIPMFAPAVRPDTQSCKPYIQQYPMLGYKSEYKLLDIHLQLDMMTTDEACIPAHPIRPMEARMLANNRMYVVRNLFVEALWLEAPSHLLTETWTSVPAIPPNSPKDTESLEYFPWFYVPVDPPMPSQALLDLVAHEARQEDAVKEEKFDRIADLLMRHYCAS
ncbi:hypothetical protein M9H77_03923 [Catharanthus roseus]|uniref:Uncharacterized protein n=1 Tax=Catharanthus roseus TaxID=4058 RepID=A0ACC0CCU0_CATRO|nr:hypothetical protein M9H77_03923 [Catharanthus roseus]